MSRIVALFASLAVASTAVASPQIFVVRPSLVGLPDTARGALEDALSQAVVDEGLSVLSQNDVAALLDQHAQLQLLGGDSDELSLASLGQTVGAKHLLAATVTRLGPATKVFVRLIDTGTNQVIGRRELSAADFDDDLLATTKAAAKLCLNAVFQDLRGTVALTVSEEGADVKVDGELVGATPLPDLLSLTGGTHLLGISKEGFLRHQQTLRITGGEALSFDVKLRPSPEFLARWRIEQGRRRFWAWTGTLVGVVLLGAGGGSWAMLRNANAEVSQLERDYNALSEDQKALRKSEFDAGILDAHNRARQFSVATIGLGAGAVVAGLIGGWGWTFGEDPDRYAQYE